MSAAGEPFVGSVSVLMVLSSVFNSFCVFQQGLCLQRGETRLRHREFVFPVVVGTCAFYLGKKVRNILCISLWTFGFPATLPYCRCRAGACRQQRHSHISGTSTCAASIMKTLGTLSRRWATGMHSFFANKVS